MNSSTLEQYLETGVKAQKMMITSLVWKESLQTKTEQLKVLTLEMLWNNNYNLCCGD